MKLFDSSVDLPKKGMEIENVYKSDTKKPVVSFTEEKHSIPFRKINEIRFDDTKFWMEASIVSYASSNGSLLNYYDESNHKR